MVICFDEILKSFLILFLVFVLAIEILISYVSVVDNNTLIFFLSMENLWWTSITIETLFAYVFYLVNLEHGLGLCVLLYKSLMWFLSFECSIF